MSFKNQIVAVMERIPGSKQILKLYRQRTFRKRALQDPVSYTHLTLPTKLEV